MAHLQRPKLRIHYYGIGRSLLQHLKPYIFERYITHMAGKLGHQQDTSTFTLKGKLCENKGNYNDAKQTMAKILGQTRIRQAFRRGLSDGQQIVEFEMPEETNELQTNEQNKQCQITSRLNANNELMTIIPRKQYLINDKLNKLQFVNLLKPIQDHLINLDDKTHWTKLLLMQPNAQFEEFMSIDFNTLGIENFNFLNLQLDQNLDISISDNLENNEAQLNNEMCIKHIENNENDCFYLKTISQMFSNLNINFNPMRCSQTNFNKFIQFALTYFVVFCVIGFLFVLIP